MAQSVNIECDYPGCSALLQLQGKAGELVGWVQRDVTDSTKKVLAQGVTPFAARTTMYLCPRHHDCADELVSPETHPELVQFLAQKENTGDPFK